MTVSECESESESESGRERRKIRKETIQLYIIRPITHARPCSTTKKGEQPLFDPERLEGLLEVVTWRHAPARPGLGVAGGVSAVGTAQFECFQRVFRVLNGEEIDETVVAKVHLFMDEFSGCHYFFHRGVLQMRTTYVSVFLIFKN